ncbi:MAG: phenylalanine--tRNA ligase subunit beta [Tannerella sp.]|jgi:phenylalanyl-tRNA synthetase beta chain|nr:phenylalanine--tRNA ligase subunit beta [Tannerella sp.]
MNISYNWLKDYLSFDLTPDETAAALTSIGLETSSVEEVQAVRGNLEGLFVGEVLTCVAHPNSDHLHLTTVNVGSDEPLRIVCGAPNVAAGQKVIVATVGTTLYDGDNEIKIKRSKIRGEESFGMICAEDEIGIGTDHSGIIVLPADARVGTPAKDYYGIASDYVLEVDITPNRVDATSHFGVARDLYAYLRQADLKATLQKPSVSDFSIESPDGGIQLGHVNPDGCLRYSGVTIRGVHVCESPDWMKKRLTTIGLRPINNIVDITNYILHELGQPLHAFDASRITGEQVIVDVKPAGTKFVTLDGIERTLTDRDLMICNTSEAMCIGGVFGGLDSGVTEQTTDVFLESACFNPSWIRKTARRFGLNTDASFRFERGLDPNQTVFVLKRAALLIKELAGGTVCGDIQDVYPASTRNGEDNFVSEPFRVDVTFAKINSLTGKEIPVETVKNILRYLDIEIINETSDGLSLHVPVYRYDVRRDVDVIEDILRIYGYNNVEFSNHVNSTLSYATPTDRSYRLENIISEQLVGAGFNEILNNSLTKASYYEGLTTYPAVACVHLSNPLSADLNVMRQTLLFGGLQSVAFNINHKNRNIRFFEFGNCYSMEQSSYSEDYRLALWMSGKRIENNWAAKDENTSVYELKAHVENIINRLGINTSGLLWNSLSNDIYESGLTIATASGKTLGMLGIIRSNILKITDISAEVYYAELSWKALLKEAGKNSIVYSEIAKYPEVKRDLALLVNTSVTFADIRRTVFESERKLLKNVVLFDVYEGANLLVGKKSYAVSFFLQDEEKTLNDKQIDAIMSKIQKALEDKLGATLR